MEPFTLLHPLASRMAKKVHRPDRAKAVTDAAVVYVALLEAARSALLLGKALSFAALAIIFCMIED